LNYKQMLSRAFKNNEYIVLMIHSITHLEEDLFHISFREG